MCCARAYRHDPRTARDPCPNSPTGLAVPPLTAPPLTAPPCLAIYLLQVVHEKAGAMYVFGGYDGARSLNDLYRFDLKTSEWAQAGDRGACVGWNRRRVLTDGRGGVTGSWAVGEGWMGMGSEGCMHVAGVAFVAGVKYWK